MFNQEQLAAIAAAMAILQNSMQSNSPSNSNNNNSTNTTTTTTTAAAADVAAAAAGQPAIANHHHLHHHHHQQQQLAEQHNLATGLQSVADLAALAQLDVLTNNHQQLHHCVAAAAHHQANNNNNHHHSLHTGTNQQLDESVQHHHHLSQHLDERLHHQQRQQQLQHHQSPFKPLTSSLTNNNDNIATKHNVNLTNGPGLDHHHNHHHHQLQQHLQQQPQTMRPIHNQHEELDFLSAAATGLPISSQLQQVKQQQQQRHQAIVNQYHSQLRHQEIQLAPSPAKQQPQPQLPQHQSQLQPPQLQQQQVLSNKPSKPQSYSAIVAKSAGHNSNGSLLNNQSNLLALEPTINYTTDHSTSPAQQLFNQSQNLNQQHQMQIQQQQQSQQQHNHHSNNVNSTALSHNTPSPGSATNLLGFMGLYVGNLSPDLTKEQLEKIFSKYGEPVKAHRLIRSPVAFIKYENTESPRAAIDDLYGLLLPDLTLNQDQPLKLHFDRNDTQLKANYRPTELPPKNDNGECYGWRTTVCRRGKNCPKKHIPINRGIDFQMWMIKTTPTATS